jgi:hypothetical protein
LIVRLSKNLVVVKKFHWIDVFLLGRHLSGMAFRQVELLNSHIIRLFDEKQIKTFLYFTALFIGYFVIYLCFY